MTQGLYSLERDQQVPQLKAERETEKEGEKEQGLIAEGAVGTDCMSGKVTVRANLVCCFKPRASVRFV